MKKKKLNKLRIRADAVKEELQKKLFNTNIDIHSLLSPKGKPVVLCIYNNIAEQSKLDQVLNALWDNKKKIRDVPIAPLLKHDPKIEDYLNATLKPQT